MDRTKQHQQRQQTANRIVKNSTHSTEDNSQAQPAKRIMLNTLQLKGLQRLRQEHPTAMTTTTPDINNNPQQHDPTDDQL
eukprot:2168086-Prorocentrum_lima.AAC.1